MEKKFSLPTFVVNLPSSLARKHYMNELLSNYPVLDYQFIDAVDGRSLSSSEVASCFDMENCRKKYGRTINGGEIGCTLSHRKCYGKIIETNLPYALILEDDITVVRDLNHVLDDDRIIRLLTGSRPVIIFLSGDYWRMWGRDICRVYASVGSYAYLINRSAAQIVLNSLKPFNVADDWDYYKELGIRLYAVHPYAVDANLEDLPSDIYQQHWGYLTKDMSIRHVIRGYWTGLVKRALVMAGRFESKKR